MTGLLRVFVLLTAAALAACAASHATDVSGEAEPRPFSASADAMADVDAALAAAEARGVNALLVLGGNWCHDSRGLAAKTQQEPLKSLIADHYELVWVDVGMRNRNLDVAERFGVMEITNTPSVLVVSPDETLLNPESVRELRNSHSRSLESVVSYLEQWAAE
ncbi:MAG: thioredoxin family protein [Euryhalocaulis sp.]|uniref:thioredoxin family protein n=1 Tax=Euryhalocaulis sp. TaxID=2744307 RepID=UPI00185D371E|nr:thioredoxin family protein [Euryhalocaulis sp.]MBA4802932.1 thioredoxin family protein [Euryhalocaulis sp.]